MERWRDLRPLAGNAAQDQRRYSCRYNTRTHAGTGPMKDTGDQFTPAELRKLRALKTPWGIQKFLDAIPYHHAGTAWSPRMVLQKKTAHCLEGAVFAAAALRVLGYPPLVFDLEAYRDDDHVLAIFQEGKYWGAIGKSNFSGLR